MTIFLNFSMTQKLNLKVVAQFFFTTNKQVVKGLNLGVTSQVTVEHDRPGERSPE